MISRHRRGGRSSQFKNCDCSAKGNGQDLLDLDQTSSISLDGYPITLMKRSGWGIKSGEVASGDWIFDPMHGGLRQVKTVDEDGFNFDLFGSKEKHAVYNSTRWV